MDFSLRRNKWGFWTWQHVLYLENSFLDEEQANSIPSFFTPLEDSSNSFKGFLERLKTDELDDNVFKHHF